MAVEGELKGLKGIKCEDCGATLPLQVCHSAAGYYLGYYCNQCGPYSRETDYFVTSKEANTELEKVAKGEEPAKLRNTDFVKGELTCEEFPNASDIDWESIDLQASLDRAKDLPV